MFPPSDAAMPDLPARSSGPIVTLAPRGPAIVGPADSGRAALRPAPAVRAVAVQRAPLHNGGALGDRERPTFSDALAAVRHKSSGANGVSERRHVEPVAARPSSDVHGRSHVVCPV